jgi:hypothetical protein
VTYAVLYGSSDRPTGANADSLGQAARLAVQHLKDGRRNVRVRLPDGEVLSFDEFERAVFSGRLRDDLLWRGAPAEPGTPAAPAQLWSVIPPI